MSAQEPFIVLSVLLSMKRVFLTLLLLCPALAQAGQWCLVIDETEFCDFVKPEPCYRAAANRGGSCRPNYKTVGASGGNRWCIVTATSKNCVHRFKLRCVNEARSIKGAGCVENIDLILRSSREGGAADGGKCDNIECEIRALGDAGIDVSQ
jgi:hypothetical protein